MPKITQHDSEKWFPFLTAKLVGAVIQTTLLDFRIRVYSKIYYKYSKVPNKRVDQISV